MVEGCLVVVEGCVPVVEGCRFVVEGYPLSVMLRVVAASTPHGLGLDPDPATALRCAQDDEEEEPTSADQIG